MPYNNNPYESAFGVVGALRNTQDLVKSIGDEYIKRKQEERMANREMAALNMERAKAETNAAIELANANRMKQEAMDTNARARDALMQNQAQFEANKEFEREKGVEQKRQFGIEMDLRYPAKIIPMHYFESLINDKKNPVDFRNSIAKLVDDVIQHGDKAEMSVMSLPQTPDDAMRSLVAISKNDPYKNAAQTATNMFKSAKEQHGDDLRILNGLKVAPNTPLAKQKYNEISQNPFIKLEVNEYTDVPIGGGAMGMANIRRVPEEELRSMVSGETQGKTKSGDLKSFATGGIGATTTKPKGGWETLKYEYHIVPNQEYISQFGNRASVDEWITNKANQTMGAVRNAVVGGVPPMLSKFSDEDYMAITRQIFDQLSENRESIDISDIERVNQFISNPENVKKIVGGYKPITTYNKTSGTTFGF